MGTAVQFGAGLDREPLLRAVTGALLDRGGFGYLSKAENRRRAGWPAGLVDIADHGFRMPAQHQPAIGVTGAAAIGRRIKRAVF